jgi:exopolysaccharide/PEP-CTERM locus tyrosine autokinase
MVASALPGDGKTFTSMNLALSMALEKDVSVLLVDADVAKPHISTTFGVAKESGLVDALANHQLDIESLVIPTDVPGLSILPAGRSNESATELLASERMVQIVAALGRADSRRIVVFDSPPLLLTSESRALADVVGQIVLVVRAGSTTKSAVRDSLVMLGDDVPVGIVLNQAVVGSGDGYYGYNYGYGSGADNV